MQLQCIAVRLHLMDGVDGNGEKVSGSSTRVGLVMDSLDHTISVQERCASIRAVDVGAKLSKRPYYHMECYHLQTSIVFSLYDSQLDVQHS